MSTVSVVYGTKSGCTAGIAERVGAALFTACLTMATDPPKADEIRAYTDPLLTETGIEPIDVGLFAGMNDPKKFSLPERLIMKAMKAPGGDFRDYDAVDTWARSVAERMGL